MTTPAPVTPIQSVPMGPNPTAHFPPMLHPSGSLYVGDLSPDVTEALLFEVFSRSGAVSSIRVCRDATTRRSLGYAYVNFHSAQDAEKALEMLNFQVIKDRPCRVMWSHRDPSVRKSSKGNTFVKNLDPSIDSKTLYDTFSTYGNILSCKVAVDPSGNSKGHGYVHFETEESANKAIAAVNGHEVKGKQIYVGKFERRAERSTPVSRYTNLYVKNIPPEWNEEKLKTAFTAFGQITSVALRVNTQKNRSFGFVNFQQHEEAVKVIEAAKEKVLKLEDGLELFVDRFQKKAERMYLLTKQHEDWKRHNNERFRNVNLYVKNLEDDVNDDKLRDMFASFGEISSAVVMRDDKDKSSKGFGFVCFASADDATKALNEMNGKLFGTKPLYVNRAQRKDERRAQLDQQFRMMPPVMYFPPPLPHMMPYPAGPGFVPGSRGPRNPQVRTGGYPSAPFPYPANMPHNQVAKGRGAPVSRGQQPSRGASYPQGRGGQKFRGAAPVQPRYREQVPIQAPQMHHQELSASVLANATPEMQKQILGERLYPLVFKENNPNAAKITGMFLEMETSDILALLDDPALLHSKVEEALQVLQEAPSN